MPLSPRSAPQSHAVNIDLFVRKFPAASPVKGSIWLIAGGPGESGATFYPFIQTLRGSFPGFDLIIPDHRGTGYSTRVCPKEEAADSPGGFNLEGAEWATCYQSMNATPDYARAFSVTNAAYDLASLIQAFHTPGPTYLYGVSYGTQLVLRLFLVSHPKIDGVILDSLVPPENRSEMDLSHRSAITDAVGREWLHHCDADAGCRTTLRGSSEVAMEAMLRTLATNEKLRNQIPGKDPRNFFGSLLDFPSTRARIPELIAELTEDRSEALDAVKSRLQSLGARLNRYPQSPDSIPLVSIISNSENNDRPNLTADQLADEKQRLLFSSILPSLLINPGVPLYARDEYYGQSPRRIPRVLILQGTLDPKTPLEGAKMQAEALKSAGKVTLLQVRDAPHFILLNAPHCFETAAQQFVGQRQLDAPACDAPELEGL